MRSLKLQRFYQGVGEMNRNIYWAIEQDCNGEEIRELIYENETKYWDSFEEVNLTNITLEQLADFLDQKAESSNQYNFIGVHRGLATFLYLRQGRDTATAMLLDIAKLGGLMELGEKETLNGLGVEKCWHDFVLPESL